MQIASLSLPSFNIIGKRKAKYKKKNMSGGLKKQVMESRYTPKLNTSIKHALLNRYWSH